VTKVSPCSKGDIVQASICKYGSILPIVTLYHADFSILHIDAAVIHLPRPEITHQVTKINFMIILLVGKKIIYA